MTRNANSFARLYERPMPFSLEAEMALLGSMLLDPRVVPDVVGVVTSADDLYAEAHRAIYGATLATYEATPNAELVEVLETLRGRGQLEQIGGADYLSKLVNETPSAAGAGRYAKIVADKARLRRLIDAADQTIFDALHCGLFEVDEIMTKSLDRVMAIGASRGGDDRVVSLAAADYDLLAQLGDKSGAQLPIGIQSFDDNTGGLPPQGLYTVYGYTSSGKTTLCLQIAGSVSIVHGFWVLVFSYEQPCRRVAATMLSAGAGINVHRLMSRGELPTDAERAKLEAVMGQHAGLRFGIVEENLNAADIYAKCAVWKAKLGPRGCVIVDYIQNLPPIAGIIDDTPRINESMRWLQRTARDLDLLVMAVSQVNRAGGTSDRPPRITDALGGVAIEARSDCIAAVYRPHLMTPCPVEPSEIPEWKEKQSIAQVHLLKSKYGPRGMATMHFNAAAMRFDSAREPPSTFENSCPPF